MSDAAREPHPSLATYERVIRPKRGLVAIDFRELWLYRELFGFLAYRDILIRYKQTYLGVAWAVLQPLLTMVVFTVVFGRMAGFSDKFNVPQQVYAVLTLAGLVPWLFFANAMSASSQSLVASANMISKIYFPRLIIPASAVISGMVDFAIALGILLAMMAVYGVAFTPALLLLPFFFAVAALAAFAVGLWLSALNVKYRDVKYVVPFLVQMGLYASPVGFPSNLVRDKFGDTVAFFYSLNPMVGVIDGFRWCVLGARFEPYWPGFAVSLVVIAVLLVTGAIYFRTAEKTFADVI
ncbi:MAG: ABC transporter permease [Verrucomicrobia bacterium]|nr:ABC transporter permease [Verrucomicrobiota bacterium]